ncbi:toll-like receptor 7 [Convolutriloba macropyga]|uniref:toll-like receptor 7 n=1 Tax=Convolutriloba macropyga TaxID=536237 RepID=UPI003F51C687
MKMVRGVLKAPALPNQQNVANISENVKIKHKTKSEKHEPKTTKTKTNNFNAIVANITIDEILEKAGETDVKAVEEVNLHACGITKIVHMEKFLNIRALDLSCNAITKIENLSNSGLKDLKLYGNMITTVSGLLDLSNLESISLQHNKISAISDGFASQKKLKTLRLDSNQLTHFEPRDFNCCRNLESLDVSYNFLESLSALKFASVLQDLTAVGNRLKKADCSGNITLVELDLSFNIIDDVSGISSLVNLQVLKLTNNKVTSLQPMGELKKLAELHMASNFLSNLNYIRKQFPNLDYLDVRNNKITDWKYFEYLKFCPSVREMYIEGNPCVVDFTSEDRKALKQVLPNMEIVDGTYLAEKDEQSSLYAKRAASASTAITVRQLENEINSLTINLDESEQNILRTFDSIRGLMNTLPLHPPRITEANNLPPDLRTSQPPTSRIGSARNSGRARLEEARLFAASLNMED